ncbi:MAG TPA: hypothetical protein VE826_09765 [Dongiaceae bacterium]|nr:hypothetical protein [Dongiaceae bacterium]
MRTRSWFVIGALAIVAGCGGTAHRPATTTPTSRATEMALERRAASYAPPSQAVLAAAGPTAGARTAAARAALARAARDLLAYRRAHSTFAVGSIRDLHRRYPDTALVDFVDARQGSFFLAVDPPTTAAIWRFDYDNGSTSRVVCERQGDRCPGLKRW